MKPNFNLEDLPRKNVFSVPENYFDKLPNRVMQRVTASTEKVNEKSWLPSPLRLAFAGSGFAAVFALVFALNLNQTPAQKTGLTALDRSEIVAYLIASEQVDQTDLVLLNTTETDFTADFITAPAEEIHRELEDQTIEDLYL